MTRRGSIIAALVSSACFGTLAVFTSVAYRYDAEPLQLLAWRFGLSAVLLGGFVAVSDPGRLRVPARDVAWYAVISILGYGAASICFFFALNFTHASVVAILLYTYPAMVALAERVFFSERLVGGRVAGVALTFAGCVLVVDPLSGTGGVATPGIVLGLGAAVGYTVFSVLSHRVLEGRPRTTLMTYLFVFTAIMAAVAAVLTGTPLSPAAWNSTVWWMLAGIVALPTFAAILLYLRALRGLGAGPAAIVSTFEPVFTIALAAVVLGEKLSVIQLAGGVLVLVGVVVAERSSRRVEEPALV